ncbi:MAG: 30S ribosomal protein S17e [Candidatus Asgardarchaeia archaeon]
MGKIRTDIIKRTARALLEKYPDLFTTDFEKNKKVIDEILVTSSKKLKNKIAGYITHIKESAAS